MQTSLLKTLAGKHRSSVAKMACKYKNVLGKVRGAPVWLAWQVGRL